MIQSRQVEAFRAVMLTGAMTAAAEMIHVTQPAVSRLIRDLEAECGFRLFERSGNTLAPTGQARSLLMEVERSFIGLRRIQEYARDLRDGRGGTLRVAALPAMSGFLPRFVAKFSRERPRLDILVDCLPSPTIREHVASGQLDIGVVAAPFRGAGLTPTVLEDNAVVALPERHRLAGKRFVAISDLGGEDMILLTKFMEGRRHPVELALQGMKLGKVIATPASELACVLVSESAGVAIVDPFSASEFVGRGIVLRPLKPASVIGTAVVRARGRAPSIAAEEFHAAFVAHAREFLQQAEFLRSAA